MNEIYDSFKSDMNYSDYLKNPLSWKLASEKYKINPVLWHNSDNESNESTTRILSMINNSIKSYNLT